MKSPVKSLQTEETGTNSQGSRAAGVQECPVAGVQKTPRGPAGAGPKVRKVGGFCRILAVFGRVLTRFAYRRNIGSDAVLSQVSKSRPGAPATTRPAPTSFLHFQSKIRRPHLVCATCYAVRRAPSGGAAMARGSADRTQTEAKKTVRACQIWGCLG